MEMPKPSEHHKKYQALAGTWSGEEILHPMPWEPKETKVTSRSVNRLDLDGFFLIIDHQQTRDGKITYRGHGVYGYDSGQQKYTMHWFDVMGCDPGSPALGTWQGNTLQFQHSHHKGHSRYIYNIEGPDKYTLKIEMSQDGKNWTPFLSGVYKKAAQ